MIISNFNSLHMSPVYPFDCGQSQDMKTCLQNAFEDLDIDLILKLLSAGANPHQDIKITSKLEHKINEKVIDKLYSRKKCVE